MNDNLFGLHDDASDDEQPFLPTTSVNFVDLISGDDGEANNLGENYNQQNCSDDDDDNDYADDDDDPSASIAPPLSKWKEIDGFKKISLSVARSKRNMWIQARSEIELIRENIFGIRLPNDVASMASTPLSKVYHTLFGQSSHLCATFCRYLRVSKTEYLHFIFTHLVSCKNQQSVSALHSSMEINNKVLMPLKHYTRIWTKIRDHEGSMKELDFWKIVESATNQQLKQLFLSNDENFLYLLGYNNDKLHFDYSSKSKLSGLSPQHHVKDNRKGLTLHTCAYSATCVPVTVHFQRMGEGVQDTYRRTIREIFGDMSLENVTMASDRGYWEKSLLFDDVLGSGANVVGTVKRVSFFF